MRAIVVAGAVAVGVGLVLVRQRRRHGGRRSWGWFTDAGEYTRDEPSTLVCVGGKVPVSSRGILWLSDGELPEPREWTTVGVGAGARAIDASGADDPRIEQLLAARASAPVQWTAPRALLSLPGRGLASIREVEATVRAVSLLAWHRANQYDGADGRPTAPSAAAVGRRRRTAVGRTLYPRVNPVAIVLVESCDGARCLLGRQRLYPPGMWTCISGFVEHGESAERAAVREVREETSVACGEARLVASQPWPCGRGAECELMLGVAARAAADGEAIDVHTTGGGGGELEAACWFDRAEVLAMIERSRQRQLPAGTPAGRVGDSAASPPALFVPPPAAIAHHLIASWAAREL
jgi:NAD+ diphosphatase